MRTGAARDAPRPPRTHSPTSPPHLALLLLTTRSLLLLPLCRYVCGVTPLKLGEFFLAYFVGALKVTFLDAYLGSMLVGAALETDELAASSKGVLVAETCAGLPS